MDKSAARKHLQMVVNFANGIPIQVWSAKDLCWYDSPNPSFRLNCIYRVKPTLTPEEKSFEDFRSAGFFLDKDSISFVAWEKARKYYQAADNKA